jgi:hypothetical protein
MEDALGIHRKQQGERRDLGQQVHRLGHYHDASMELVTVPLTLVTFSSAQTLRVDVGLFNGLTCSAR